MKRTRAIAALAGAACLAPALAFAQPATEREWRFEAGLAHVGGVDDVKADDTMFRFDSALGTVLRAGKPINDWLTIEGNAFVSNPEWTSATETQQTRKPAENQDGTLVMMMNDDGENELVWSDWAPVSGSNVSGCDYEEVGDDPPPGQPDDTQTRSVDCSHTGNVSVWGLGVSALAGAPADWPLRPYGKLSLRHVQFEVEHPYPGQSYDDSSIEIGFGAGVELTREGHTYMRLDYERVRSDIDALSLSVVWRF